ncbi:hypothetical protein B0H13DRAFT_2463392 [Mycena leptocephala]|nr:hypothetical protein B0H13DRAFT_2463392 [Mycena leptocephala]
MSILLSDLRLPTQHGPPRATTLERERVGIDTCGGEYARRGEMPSRRGRRALLTGSRGVTLCVVVNRRRLDAPRRRGRLHLGRGGVVINIVAAVSEPAPGPLELVKADATRAYHGCSCYPWVEGMLRLRRGGSQARASGIWLCASALPSLPSLPSLLLPSFFSSSPTNPSLFQILTLTLGMLGYKYVHIYGKWSWIPSSITFFVVLGSVFIGSIFRFEYECDPAFVPFTCVPAHRSGGGHDGEIGMMMVMDAEAARRRANDACGAEARVVETEMDAQAMGGSAPQSCVAGGPAPSNDAWELWQVRHGAAGAQRGGKEYYNIISACRFSTNEKGWVLMSCGCRVHSMGNSISVTGVWLAKVPRLVWPIGITAIYIPIAIVDANSFSASLEDFMNVLGYWLSIFVVVILLEHFVLLQGRLGAVQHRGDAESAGQNARRYRGTSGVFVWRARDGDEIWYIGKIGALVGMGRNANPSGGDIGFELSGVFAGIFYLPARYLELKYIGR